MYTFFAIRLLVGYRVIGLHNRYAFSDPTFQGVPIRSGHLFCCPPIYRTSLPIGFPSRLFESVGVKLKEADTLWLVSASFIYYD